MKFFKKIKFFFNNLKLKKNNKLINKKKNKINKNLSFSKKIKKLSEKYKISNNLYIKELENILISSDMSIEIVLKIMNKIKNNFKDNQNFTIEDINNFFSNLIIDLYNNNLNNNNNLILDNNNLNIILFVGVNGSGKTTTIGKLAKKFIDKNKKVLIVAADTFRAGAVEQLNNLVSILKVKVVNPIKENQDPASVVFDGIRIAKKENYDIVLIDTAGRLQNKTNLMNELNKINNIIKKENFNKFYEKILVIDSVTGQNGLSQAKNFLDIIELTGVILTKMDGTAKGGIILSIKEKFNLPVKFIGYGEKLNDLEEFDIKKYIYNNISKIFLNINKEKK